MEKKIRTTITIARDERLDPFTSDIRTVQVNRVIQVDGELLHLEKGEVFRIETAGGGWHFYKITREPLLNIHVERLSGKDDPKHSTIHEAATIVDFRLQAKRTKFVV